MRMCASMKKTPRRAQSFFESCMYTFVFMWTPAMEAGFGKAHLPYGPSRRDARMRMRGMRMRIELSCTMRLGRCGPRSFKTTLGNAC